MYCKGGLIYCFLTTVQLPPITDGGFHIYQLQGEKMLVRTRIESTELVFDLGPACMVCSDILYALDKFYVQPNSVRTLTMTKPGEVGCLMRAYTLFYFRHYTICEKMEYINDVFMNL